MKILKGMATLTCNKCNKKITKKFCMNPFSFGTNSTKEYLYIPCNKLSEILNYKMIHVCNKNDKRYGIASISDIDFNDTDVDLINMTLDDNDCVTMLRINDTINNIEEGKV